MMREGFIYFQIVSHKVLLCLPNHIITDVKFERQVLKSILFPKAWSFDFQM
jgi:hypothetical protein